MKKLVLFIMSCWLLAGCGHPSVHQHKQAATKMIKNSRLCGGASVAILKHQNRAMGIVEVRCPNRVFIVYCYAGQASECKILYRHDLVKQP